MVCLKEIRSNRFYKNEMSESVCILVSGFIVFALSILAIRFSGKRPVFLVFGVFIMMLSSCCMCYACRKTNKTYKDAKEAYVANVKNEKPLEKVVVTAEPSVPDRIESREEGY